MVPTWNYVAVHAYGTCRLVDDADPRAAILAATVAAYERSMPQPWSIDTGTAFFQKMARAVAGFRIEIRRLEGKWKLNQNHPQGAARQSPPRSGAIARPGREGARPADAGDAGAGSPGARE